MGKTRYSLVRWMVLAFMLLGGVEARSVTMLVDPGPLSAGNGPAPAAALQLPDPRFDLVRLDAGPSFATGRTLLERRGPAVPDPRSALLRLDPGEQASAGGPQPPDVRYALVRLEPAGAGARAATGRPRLDAGPIGASPFAAAPAAEAEEVSLRLDLRCLRLAVADSEPGAEALTAASGWARACFERLV